jgi:hypothetical protein
MRVLTILLTLFAAAAVFAQEQEQEPYSEIIDVVRYTLDVRVTDSWGHAIDDLKAADFTVTIGGKPAHVVSAKWIGEGQRLQLPDAATSTTEEAEEADPGAEDADAEDMDVPEEVPDQPDHRSIVIFIQTDFARVSDRVAGQMKFNYVADKILKMLGPYDRVAVVSHDSHLKFRRDFTMDRQSIRKAVRESLYIDEPPTPPAATEGPSLVGLLDPKQMKRAANAESALLVIANALHAVDGTKMIILAGWGIGELQGRAGVMLKEQWNEAVQVLHEDHVPVIALDTGLGAQLMAGLKATAEATGGFYADTRKFDAQALTRVNGALAGHYALLLRLDDPLEPGRYPLGVRVNRKGLEVQAPPFVDHAP